MALQPPAEARTDHETVLGCCPKVRRSSATGREKCCFISWAMTEAGNAFLNANSFLCTPHRRSLGFACFPFSLCIFPARHAIPHVTARLPKPSDHSPCSSTEDFDTKLSDSNSSSSSRSAAVDFLSGAGRAIWGKGLPPGLLVQVTFAELARLTASHCTPESKCLF